MSERMGMVVKRRLMVVGALPGNLGYQVGLEAGRSQVWERIEMFDLNGDNSRGVCQYLDLGISFLVEETVKRVKPTDIVCTVGMNAMEATEATILPALEASLRTNLMGPMRLLTEALDMWETWGNREPVPETGFNFCALSSNSAHIARSQSTGYCASKAGLSMALRCVARRMAGGDVQIWGYEPGFLEGTPMSEATAAAFPDKPLHRIPGGEGLIPHELAERIVADLIVSPRGINGVMFRIDGGEQ